MNNIHNSQKNNQMENLDELIASIKQEALIYEQQNSSDEINYLSNPEFINDHLSLKSQINLSSNIGDIEEESSEIRDIYYPEDFLSGSDSEFLTKAYQIILHRDIDPSGKQSYLKCIQKQGRIFVLCELMLSDEAAQYEPCIDHMSAYLKHHKWLKKLRFQHLKTIINKIFYRQDRKFSAHKNTYPYQLIAELKQQINTLNKGIQKQIQQLQNTQVRELQLNQLQQKEWIEALRLKVLKDEYEASSAKDKLSQYYISNEQSSLSEQDKLSQYYIAFEDACRGQRQDIKNNLKYYLPILEKQLSFIRNDSQKNSLSMVDLGCGRGEWLELLNEKKYSIVGIDNNRHMVESCLSMNLSAEYQDILDYLIQQPKASLSLISGFHIIEHLPFNKLYYLFEIAFQKLAAGGMILFETPNPENILVGSHTFYHDPTHHNPITPTSISFLAKYHGFIDISIHRLHPYNKEAEVPGEDPLTQRINGHLCGPQDFAIIANKPVDSKL